MKELKNKIIPDPMFYFVLEYLNATNCQPVFKRQWETYDLTKPQTMRKPLFNLGWLNYDQFNELFNEALDYFRKEVKDIESSDKTQQA